MVFKNHPTGVRLLAEPDERVKLPAGWFCSTQVIVVIVTEKPLSTFSHTSVSILAHQVYIYTSILVYVSVKPKLEARTKTSTEFHGNMQIYIYVLKSG